MELKQVTQNAESIENKATTDNSNVETTEVIEETPEPTPEPEPDPTPEPTPEPEPQKQSGYTTDKTEYFKNTDFTVKQDNNGLLDFVKQPTTSPTMQEEPVYKEDENFEYFPDEDDENIKYTKKEKEDKKQENTGLTEITKQKEEKKKKVQYEVSADDLEFVCYLFISGLDWLYGKGMKMAGYEAQTTEEQRRRLVSVYAKGLAYYNIRLSPLWAMIIITVIIYGGASMKAKAIEKDTKEVPKEKTEKNVKKDKPENKQKDENKDNKQDNKKETNSENNGVANIL